MTSQQLLDLIDQRKLVPATVVAKLRGQISDPRKRATPKALLKVLVAKGHLTATQAKNLLSETMAATADNPDDLGFALIDDDPPSDPLATAEKASSGSQRRPTIVPELESRLAGKGSVREAWRVEDTPRPRDPQPADDLLGELLDVPLGPSTPLPSTKSRWPWSRKAVPRKAGDPWDSPLLLLGGGGLAALVVLGGFLYWRIGRGNAEQSLERAETAYRDQAYAPAAEQYAAFATRFPSHERASFARVQAGLARLRLATSGNAAWPQALAMANEVIPSISNEADFSSARDELTSMLPAISEGLAQQARLAADKAAPELPPAEAKPLAAQAQTRLDEARTSLTLVERYVPATQRPAQRLRDVELLLATTARDIARTAELDATVAAIDQAIGKGDLNAAYDARRKLLREHPALAANAALDAQIRRLAGDMLKTAKTSQPNRAANSQEAASPILAVATPWALEAAEPPSGAERQFVPLVADGVAYGVEGSSGKLLWRRYVGAGATSPALPLEGPSAALLIDIVRNELLCLDRWTGALQWRQAVEGRPFAPAVAGPVAVVATAGSRLDLFDAASGRLLREAVLPQPPAAAPAAGAQRPNCYVVAEHSNLYTIEIASGACQEVTYVGHELGSVRAAPALLLRYVVIAENHQAEASRLHVFTADAEGKALKLVQQIPLGGWVTTPLAVSGSRLVAATDRGGIYVFEAREQSPEPLVVLAQRPVTGDAPKERFVSAREGRILVADDRLTLFELQAARGRLDPRWVEQPDLLALQAPVITPTSVVSVGRPQHQAALRVAARKLDKGGALWQAALQPLAAEPVLEQDNLVAVGALGDVFSVPAKSLARGRAALTVAGSAVASKPAWLTQVERAKSGELLATAAGQLSQCLVVESVAPATSVRWLELPELQPSTPPVSFGEGLLIADTRGQVHLLSLAGQRLAQPFQPPQAAGSHIDWRAPGVAANAAQGAVLSDGGTRLFRLTLVAEPQPRLIAAATGEVVEPITSAVAVVGNTAYAFDAGGWLRAYAVEDLRPLDPWRLNAQPTWGPQRCGEHVYATTDADELLCLDGAGKLLWRVPLPHGPLAGKPLETPQGVVCASTRGVAWRVNLADGKEAARVDLAQPAATGFVAAGDQWVAAGRDGALLSIAPF